MQWQHGTYEIFANGSLIMTPFAVDGRQLMSDPCNGDDAVYTRYNQTETMEVCQLSLFPPPPSRLSDPHPPPQLLVFNH